MAEVLSQSEIDALLAAVSSGSIETDEKLPAEAGGEKSSTDWIAYDLTSHEKLVRGRLVALQGIHERFSRLFRSTLSQALKRNVSVNCTSTDFLRFSDYLGNILLPTSLNVVSMTNLKGHMLFVFTSKLAYALVDAYYGGTERPFSKIGGREEFTSIENNMVKKICQLAIKDMKDAWKLNFPVELDYQRTESNPHFVGNIHGSEMVAVVTFNVEFENLSGSFIAILQVRALDQIQQFLSVNVTTEIPPDAHLWQQHWVGELRDLKLDTRATLGSAEIPLDEIRNWKVGDILALHQDATEPIQVYLEGVPKIKGMMGVYRGNSAVRVTDLAPSK